MPRHNKPLPGKRRFYVEYPQVFSRPGEGRYQIDLNSLDQASELEKYLQVAAELALRTWIRRHG